MNETAKTTTATEIETGWTEEDGEEVFLDEDGDHDLSRCPCGGCDEDRAEARQDGMF